MAGNMDLKKLVNMVSQCPPLWDRNHEKFRDQDMKAAIWKEIGIELNATDVACREAYKSLREKYIREREKYQQYGTIHQPWELLDYMQFLDPYILYRKSGSNTSTSRFEDFVAIKQDPTETDNNLEEVSDIAEYRDKNNGTRNFCKKLIKMVYQSRALWDRNCRDYNDKPTKDCLWQAIANSLQSDATSCALKWKSLREKYIRQKPKHCEGEQPKWEFLDDMSFLDNVILYRKKQWKLEERSLVFPTIDNSYPLSHSNSDYEVTEDYTNDSTANQLSISDTIKVKPTPACSLIPHVPDSTLEIINTSGRKRTLSNASEVSSHNTKKSFLMQERKPEQIFGELVAAMLAAKPADEKNMVMMEIMSILTKPSRPTH